MKIQEEAIKNTSSVLLLQKCTCSKTTILRVIAKSMLTNGLILIVCEL